MSEKQPQVHQEHLALPGGEPRLVHTPSLVAAARALARQHAEVCNVDFDDLWKLESESFFDDARRVLKAAGHDELLTALRPFARFASGFGPHGRDDSWVIAATPTGKTLTMCDVRLARAALSKATGT